MRRVEYWYKEELIASYTLYDDEVAVLNIPPEWWPYVRTVEAEIEEPQ